MATANLYNRSGETVGKVDLPDSLFAQEVHKQALYEAVRCYLANQRQGTHDTKTRGEVCKSSRKLYRQKGTGRARADSAKSPLRVGGGTVFGPHPRDYGYKLPKKVKRLALCSALSDRAANERVAVVEDFAMEKPRTAELAKLLKGIATEGRHTLVVLPDSGGNVFKSLRNIQGVRVMRHADLNTYTILWADNLVFTKGSLSGAEEVFGA